MSHDSARRRVLFFAEPATFAHVVRPLVLARFLDPADYDVHFATAPDFFDLIPEPGILRRELASIGIKAYLQAVARGQPVYGYATLKWYVEEDLRHIDEVRPDLIVGDFRLSLAVSARLRQIPYYGIANAYWSPYAEPEFEVPVHALTRLVGARPVNALFRYLRTAIFAQHSVPMHRLRRRYGLSSLGFDLRSVFTEADVTLFADIPELVPTRSDAPASRYLYLGPVVWSPRAAPLNEYFYESSSRPLIYVSIGSSGNENLLHEIVGACLALGYRVAVTSGGRRVPSFGHPDVYSARYLPGDEIAARAKLVICNGGSPTTHQALMQGVPVLGIPSNLDQLLNMYFIKRSAAGLKVRADSCTQNSVKEKIVRLIDDDTFSDAAQRVASAFAMYSPKERFRSALAS